MTPHPLTIEISPEAAETINVRRFELIEAVVAVCRGHDSRIAEIEKLGVKIIATTATKQGEPT